MTNIEYKDMYKKFCFHKEQIIKSLLKQGIYPEDSLVEETMANIDCRLALFKQYVFSPGDAVNVKELNYAIEMIHKDLEFLYEIVIDICTSEYYKLTTFVESHLSQLESMVDKYEKRAKEETNSTTFGKTLLFESNSFDIETNDNRTLVNLGELDLVSGTTIACFANINNIESQDVYFTFDTDEASKCFNTLSYNYNNSKALVPGELSVNKTELELNKDFVITDHIRINMNNLNHANDYKIMGGKNCVLVKNIDTMQEHIYQLPSFETTLTIPFRAHVSFYVVDGKEFEYIFNTRPTHTNFSLNNSTVKVSGDNSYVFMEVPENFTFGISLSEGEVYAVKENGIIKDNVIFYYGNKDVNSLQVREYVRDKKDTYNVKAIIQSNDISYLDIDSIYIKELS